MFHANLKKAGVVLVLAVAATAQAAGELDATRAGFAKAMAARNVEDIARYFDEKGILVNQDGSLAQGKDEIKKGFRQILAAEGMQIRSVPDSSRTVRNGDIILRSGRWQWVDASGKVQEEWFASEVFRQNSQGDWVYLIDNPYNKLP